MELKKNSRDVDQNQDNCMGVHIFESRHECCSVAQKGLFEIDCT